MIEKVLNGKESDNINEIRIPKNIKQIGESKSSRKVYIEDYVINTLKKKPEQENRIKYGVLLGEIKRGKGNTYVFIRGMIETREVIENSIIFNDDIWSAIYKDVKYYFPDTEIVGWFVNVPYTVKNEMGTIQKLHLDNFAGNDKVCFLTDRTENEEGFFVYEQGKMNKQTGYYVFYEKNERMKKYLQQTQGQRSVAVETESDAESKKVNTAKEMKNGKTGNETKVNDSKVKHMSFREMLKQQIDEENSKGMKTGKVTYALSSLLIIALLLSTVVMLNNYGELKSLKTSIENMSDEANVIAVNEIISSMLPSSNAYDKDNENKDGNVSGGGDEKESGEVSTDNLNEAGNTPTENQGGEDGEGVTNDSVSGNVDDQDAQNPDGDSGDSGVGNDTGVQDDEDDVNDTEQDTKKTVSTMYSGLYHTVKKGQTLYDISMTYYGDNSMVEPIKELNSIDDDYVIKEGQKLLLP